MLRRTPLYDRQLAAGGRFVPFAGFEMAVQYAGLGVEHRQVRESVGLFDVSHMGEIRVKGPGAAAFLDHVMSNNMADMAIGQARYTLICNEGGGVVDDAVVYRLSADDFLVCVNASNRDKDWAWISGHVRPDDQVTLTDEGDDWVQIAVQGRNAEATVQALTAVDLSQVKYYWFATGAVAQVDGCILARTGYTGEDGFELFVPAASGPRVWDALMDAGSPFRVMAIGLGARDTLRLEARMSLYGHELDDDTSPAMAGLMRVCKLDKPGGFVGSEAVAARQATDTQVLIGALVDDRKIVREGMSVLVDGAVVGRVTSGTMSPTLEQGVVLAYVPRALAAPGTRLSFDVRGRVATGTVVKGPFYSAPKKTS